MRFRNLASRGLFDFLSAKTKKFLNRWIEVPVQEGNFHIAIAKADFSFPQGTEFVFRGIFSGIQWDYKCPNLARFADAERTVGVGLRRLKILAVNPEGKMSQVIKPHTIFRSTVIGLDKIKYNDKLPAGFNLFRGVLMAAGISPLSKNTAPPAGAGNRT